jgi:hypothetical protein
MGTEGNAEQEIIAQLREKAERLAYLEARLEAFEQERKKLVDSKKQLSGQLAHYHRSLKEWDWFFENSVQMLCIAGLDGYFKRVNLPSLATSPKTDARKPQSSIRLPTIT